MLSVQIYIKFAEFIGRFLTLPLTGGAGWVFFSPLVPAWFLGSHQLVNLLINLSLVTSPTTEYITIISPERAKIFQRWAKPIGTRYTDLKAPTGRNKIFLLTGLA